MTILRLDLGVGGWEVQKKRAKHFKRKKRVMYA